MIIGNSSCEYAVPLELIILHFPTIAAVELLC